MWVLTAHLLTILVPLVLVMAVACNIDFLDSVLDVPELLYVAAGPVRRLGSVCEKRRRTRSTAGT